MTSPYYTPTGNPVQGSTGASKAIRDEFALIEAGIDAMNIHCVTAVMADINTAGSTFVSVPFACEIKGVYMAVQVDNSGADTTITLEIGGTEVTMDPIIYASDGVKENIIYKQPTALNVVAEGGVIEVVSDGGGTPVCPANFQIVLERKA